MANPNIVSVASIYGESVGWNLTATTTTTLMTVSSGKLIKIKFCTQLPAKTPQFAFFCNHPKLIKDAYRRFLENQLRKNYNFSGVTISIFFRKKWLKLSIDNSYTL